MQLPVVATAIVLAAFTVAPATAEEYDSRIDALAEGRDWLEARHPPEPGTVEP